MGTLTNVGHSSDGGAKITLIIARIHQALNMSLDCANGFM